MGIMHEGTINPLSLSGNNVRILEVRVSTTRLYFIFRSWIKSIIEDKSIMVLEKIQSADDIVGVSGPEVVKETEKIRPATFKELYADADATDYFLMFIGTLGSMGTGASLPVFCIVFSQALDKLNGGGAVQESVNTIIYLFIIIAGGNIAVSFVQVVGWTISGERISQKLRTKYVKAMLSQEIGWFDTCGAGELSTRVADSCGKLQDGMGRRISDALQHASQFVFSFIAALYLSWQLTVVLLATFPVIAWAGYFMIQASTAAQNESAEQYAQAGGLATEVLSGIRTITALNAQLDAITRYRKFILEAMDVGIMKGLKVGLGIGMLFSLSFFTYALGFWYGAKLIADQKDGGCTENCLTGGTVIAVFFSVILGAQAMGQVAPPLGAFVAAKAAAGGMVEVINRKPLIDGLSDTGSKPTQRPKGAIELRAVDFSYPSRPHIMVCEGYDLSIAPGETVALCGASGAGKSTIMNLLLRFYDPSAGGVFLDGTDMRTFNVRWLRNCFGYVGQEPVLFAGTIAENIAFGLDTLVDGDLDPQTLRERVIDAAKQANAHDFILSFPEGYDTDVGTNGGSMSGGQKQRIAIARALIKQPAVLLLDEATSALDTASERIVQQSIDALQQSRARTTIIIAHRLSTIRTADRIAVVSGGKIAELGTHEELLALNGLYSELVSLQMGGDIEPEPASAGPLVSDTTHTAPDSTDDVAVPSGSTGSIIKNTDATPSSSETKFIPTKGPDSKTGSRIPPKTAWARVRVLVCGQIWWLMFGLLGAAMVGAAFPIWGYLLASFENTFYILDIDVLRKESVTIAIRFILLGIGSFIGFILQNFCIAQVGQRICAALRSDMFESLMRREIGFFDDENNAVGNLTTQLAEDARLVHIATGETLSNQLQAFFTLVVGLIIGFSASWKVSLVVLATFPINIAAGALTMAEWQGQHLEDGREEKEGTVKRVESKNDLAELTAEGETKALKVVEVSQVKGEGGLISMAFVNMRTISAFSLQYEVSKKYSAMTLAKSMRKQNSSYYTGFVFGLSQGATYLTYALLFWYGTTLVVAGEINFVELMIAILALMLGALGLGQAISNLGSQKDGLNAAERIFAAIDAGKASPIDGLSTEGLTPPRPQGRIELKNVFFRYPTRPNAEVCKDYSLVIEPGQVVALVGPSGSGKSTIMNLLLRFYDPVEGQVLLDGQDIRSLNVRWLRSQIGYVGQEPTLFSGGVADNIARGRVVTSSAMTLQQAIAAKKAEKTLFKHPKKKIPDIDEAKNTVIDMEEGANKDGVDDDIIAASKSSYAHDFITSFPNGYLTDVGESSVMVSGGQKQRIAIARALIKQPAVLLLDEATSALDTASERIVQQSIDELQNSRAQTIIVIAHRLTTIRNADKIVVIDKGMVVQTGTHDELLLCGGLYSQLWNKQSGQQGKQNRGSK